jgi:hypothetical protein
VAAFVDQHDVVGGGSGLAQPFLPLAVTVLVEQRDVVGADGAVGHREDDMAGVEGDVLDLDVYLPVRVEADPYLGGRVALVDRRCQALRTLEAS